jgi:DNA-binding protein H-NS
MTTYSELQKQIATLQEKAEKQRIAELESVINDIKSKISEYNITAKDLGFTTRSKKVKSTEPVPPKYKNKKGDTWTGRGRQPTWIKDAIASGKSIDTFLIKE